MPGRACPEHAEGHGCMIQNLDVALYFFVGAGLLVLSEVEGRACPEETNENPKGATTGGCPYAYCYTTGAR